LADRVIESLTDLGLLGGLSCQLEKPWEEKKRRAISEITDEVMGKRTWLIKISRNMTRVH
jgi:hypothetical protein